MDDLCSPSADPTPLPPYYPHCGWWFHCCSPPFSLSPMLPFRGPFFPCVGTRGTFPLILHSPLPTLALFLFCWCLHLCVPNKKNLRFHIPGSSGHIYLAHIYIYIYIFFSSQNIGNKGHISYHLMCFFSGYRSPLLCFFPTIDFWPIPPILIGTLGHISFLFIWTSRFRPGCVPGGGCVSWCV